MVAREAMAHGRPVVATAVGGLVDAVEDGVTGLLVPPRDAPALREAIESLIGDARRRAAFGRAASLRAAAMFAPNSVGGEWRRVYDDVQAHR